MSCSFIHSAFFLLTNAVRARPHSALPHQCWLSARPPNILWTLQFRQTARSSKRRAWMKNCFMTCLQSVFLEVQRMRRGGRGIKDDGGEQWTLQGIIGVSLYIFYDACDVKIKSNLSPQGLCVCVHLMQRRRLTLLVEGFTLAFSVTRLHLHFLFGPRSNILIWEDCVQKRRLNAAYVVRWRWII